MVGSKSFERTQQWRNISSLQNISKLLQKHLGIKVVLLCAAITILIQIRKTLKIYRANWRGGGGGGGGGVKCILRP